jgi:hypothetical protein
MLDPALLLWLRKKLPELLRPLLGRLVEERLKSLPKTAPQTVYLGGGGGFGGSGGGVTAHGALTGLDADDHAHYHTDTRGDARYSRIDHAHAGIYEPADTGIQGHIGRTDNPHGTTAAQVGAYTIAQADALLAGKAAGTHVHVLANITDLASLTIGWTNLTGKPSSFPPSAHAHAIGDTAGLQTALDGKQPLDTDLVGLAGLTTTGFVVRTADGTFATRTLTPNAGVSISNGSGVVGNPVFLNGDTGSAAVNAHEIALDPHAQYHTDVRGDARYLKLSGGTLSGAVTFGTSNPNPALRIRHLNGKAASADTDDTLYLNYSAPGKGVVVGDTGTDHPLTAFGDITAGGYLRSNRAWDGVYGGLHLSGFKPSITLWDTDQSKKWLIHCAADSLFFYRATTGAETAADWVSKVYITSTGQIACAALAGSGNRAVYSDAGGALTNSASDRRLKKDIAPLGYGLAEVLRLAPVFYRWKDPHLGGGREIGLIAQDVRDIIPEVIGRNADGMLSLDYPKLVAVLVLAIQELNDKLQRLAP